MYTPKYVPPFEGQVFPKPQESTVIATGEALLET